MEELDMLRRILNKVDQQTTVLDDMRKRLRSLEAGVEFIRKNFETNGKLISVLQDKLSDHAREISDLGYEVRGTPTPARVAGGEV